MAHERRPFRERLPLILSLTALVVAVFGATPIGEATLDAVPLRSVGTAQLKANAVTSEKVKNGTLRRVDFARDALPAAAAKGEKGDKGDRGEKGEKGDPGPRTPAWGDVTGPGFGADFTLWKDTSFRLTLQRTPEGRYFVFGRFNVEVNCGSAACSQSYALFVNELYVPQTSFSVSAPANGRARANVSVFGAATVPRSATPAPVLSARYRTFGTLTTSTVGVSLGAIALG